MEIKINLNLSIGFILTVILFILKLVNYIDWSWIWIFSPLLINLIICLVILFVFWIKYLRWLHE